MDTKAILPKIWLQAAVLGSLWAVSEILLGSFFHNLRIPMRSMILGAIGVILMVAIGRKWSAKGLFWRAGLICALMKSVSPSGVIFSPMIAIFAQACLMELSVRSVGRNIFGFMIGGTLALCWNLFQFILSYILLYGYDIVGIYKSFYKMAGEVFRLPEGNFWFPVYISLGMHLFFGMFAAISGFLLSNYKGKPLQLKDITKTPAVRKIISRQKQFNKRSIPLLVINISLFCGYFISAALISSPYNLLPTIPLLVFWIVKYRRSLQAFIKPTFWLFFILITMVSAMAIDQAQNGATGFSIEGFWVGIAINIRAITLVTGLSVIGFELGNPAIRKRLSNRSLKNLFMALEAASNTFPLVIANIPDSKVFFLRPRAVFAQQIAEVNFWLQELEARYCPHDNVAIISGAIHSGKTTLLKQLVPIFQKQGLKAGGFFCPAVFDNGVRQGYDIADLEEKQRLPLGRKNVSGNFLIGDYYFLQQGMDYGFSLLEDGNVDDLAIVVIDEIGPWEISGHGWAKCIPALLQKNNLLMIWVVRENILDAVIQRWNLTDVIVINTSNATTASIASTFVAKCVALKSAMGK